MVFTKLNKFSLKVFLEPYFTEWLVLAWVDLLFSGFVRQIKELRKAVSGQCHTHNHTHITYTQTHAHTNTQTHTGKHANTCILNKPSVMTSYLPDWHTNMHVRYQTVVSRAPISVITLMQQPLNIIQTRNGHASGNFRRQQLHQHNHITKMIENVINIM